MKLTNEQIRAACEAILFASGEPLECARIAEALELDMDTVSGALWELARILDERGSGICLLRLGSKYQLCSRVEYAQQVRRVLDIKKNAPLSPAAFEVLAVVAYNQPVTKAYVEQIRGVPPDISELRLSYLSSFIWCCICFSACSKKRRSP